jgi:hypothetical protein
VLFSTLLHLPPLRLQCVSEDAGIETWTVAMLILAAYLLSNKYRFTILKEVVIGLEETKKSGVFAFFDEGAKAAHVSPLK